MSGLASQHRGFYQAANPIHALCAKDHTNQPTVSGPECAKCGTSQPASWAGQGPARVAHGSKISSLRVFNTRTSKWVKMGYFTPLQAPRSIFSPLSILKLRHEGHSGLLDALGCQGKEPLRPLRRGRPLRECAKCGTNQPTSGGLECAEWGTTQPTQGPEWVNRVGSLVKPSGAGHLCTTPAHQPAHQLAAAARAPPAPPRGPLRAVRPRPRPRRPSPTTRRRRPKFVRGWWSGGSARG